LLDVVLVLVGLLLLRVGDPQGSSQYLVLLDGYLTIGFGPLFQE
jgi:hypothetical protein